jgi:sugar phosphate isomerase/epimerase
MKYLICPSRGSAKTADDFKRIADDFNSKAEICRKNGIRFAYHNHEYSFKEVDGLLPQDIMMKNTNPALVDFEMDIYWVVTGKSDPMTWFKKYPNRFRLGHFKDRIKGATERDASCTLGTGSIDYPAIGKAAKEAGMQYFIVEQERYEGTTPLKAAEDDSKYMQKLEI